MEIGIHLPLCLPILKADGHVWYFLSWGMRWRQNTHISLIISTYRWLCSSVHTMYLSSKSAIWKEISISALYNTAPTRTERENRSWTRHVWHVANGCSVSKWLFMDCFLLLKKKVPVHQANITTTGTAWHHSLLCSWRAACNAVTHSIVGDRAAVSVE